MAQILNLAIDFCPPALFSELHGESDHVYSILHGCRFHVNSNLHDPQPCNIEYAGFRRVEKLTQRTKNFRVIFLASRVTAYSILHGPVSCRIEYSCVYSILYT